VVCIVAVPFFLISVNNYHCFQNAFEMNMSYLSEVCNMRLVHFPCKTDHHVETVSKFDVPVVCAILVHSISKICNIIATSCSGLSEFVLVREGFHGSGF
jgi:hypothetical protein